MRKSVRDVSIGYEETYTNTEFTSQQMRSKRVAGVYTACKD